MVVAGILFTFSLLLAACSAAGKPPRVSSHPAPDVTVDFSPFEDAGCADDGSGRSACPEDSPLGKLGCDYISSPGDYLGGLDPNYPIALCWASGPQALAAEGVEYIYRDGCLMPQLARYVIERDGQFELLETQQNLKQAYAPIISETEALSYAIASTGLSAYFGFEAPRGFRYFVDKLEDSHVVATSQGYLVYLYDYQLCGCGPHTTSYVELEVLASGEIKETGRIPVFEDPEQDGLCVD